MYSTLFLFSDFSSIINSLIEDNTSFFSSDPLFKNLSDKKMIAFLIISFSLSLPFTDIEFPLV